MKLYGKLIKQNIILRDAEVVIQDNERQFHDTLEDCFLELCRQLDVPVPVWMKKNTKELAIYRSTYFDNEQFLEEVLFDKMNVRWEQL